MGVIIRNGIEYSGSGMGGGCDIVYLTQAEYDALPDSKENDNIEYRITDAGVRGSAENVGYDNSTSGLDAKNVQGAIDKLNDSLGDITGFTNETYNSVGAFLQYCVDNGYLPDVNVNYETINLTLQNLTAESYLNITRVNKGTARLSGRIKPTNIIGSTTAIVDIGGIPEEYRPKNDVEFSVMQIGSDILRNIVIKTDGSITIDKLSNATETDISQDYSLN